MNIYLNYLKINCQNVKCAKYFSIQFHFTGACASWMCHVEFAATLFIVPSLLTLAVCVS